MKWRGETAVLKFNKICTMVSFLILSTLAVFSAIITARLPGVFVFILLYVLMMLFAVLTNVKNGKLYLVNNIPKFYLPWIFFSIFVFWGFIENSLPAIRILCCIFIAIILQRSTDWIRVGVKCVALLTGINVFFTYFFFLLPDQYSTMINLYGYIPSGTSGGTAGYRAGITNHYSQNGIYISVFLMIIIMIFIGRNKFKKKEKFSTWDNALWIMFISVTAIALLLTGKRGVLIWSTCAIVFSYFIASQNKLGTFLKIGLIILTALGFLQILIESVPDIGYVFERFQDAGTDVASLERFSMWKLALSKFKNNPVFGNGFFSFRKLYFQNLANIYHPGSDRFQRLDAHNVYFQVLCETGIIGFICYIFAIALLLVKTVNIVRVMAEKGDRDLFTASLISLSLQIFYCIYSFTGNCLYDIVFFFYSLAMAITLALNYDLKKEIREEQDHA